MTLRVWPDTLPVAVTDGYRLMPMDQSLCTEMEVGFARQRRLTTARHDMIEATWIFTDAEMTAFRAFFGDIPWSLSGDSDDLTSWQTVNVTLSPNAAAGLDGAVADKLREDTVTANHYAQRLLDAAQVPASSTILFRATLKQSGRTWGRIVFRAWDGTLCRTDVDLANGVFGGSANILSRTIENRGSGWYRVTITASTGSGVTAPLVRINVLTADGTPNYLGDGNSGILVHEVSTRIVTGYNLFLRTGPDGRVTGADGGAAWFQSPLAFGGGVQTAECRFHGPFSAEALPALGWQVSGKLEVRNA